MTDAMVKEALAKRIEETPVGQFAILLGLNDGTHFNEIIEARATIAAALRAPSPAVLDPEKLTDGELIQCLEELRRRDDKEMRPALETTPKAVLDPVTVEALDAAIKALTGFFSILRGKSYAKDSYQIEVSHGLYNELRDVRDNFTRIRALTGQPRNAEAVRPAYIDLSDKDLSSLLTDLAELNTDEAVTEALFEANRRLALYATPSDPQERVLRKALEEIQELGEKSAAPAACAIRMGNIAHAALIEAGIVSSTDRAETEKLLRLNGELQDQLNVTKRSLAHQCAIRATEAAEGYIWFKRTRELWAALSDGPEPRCRDCADCNGRCQNDGPPCDPQERALERIKTLRSISLQQSTSEK